MPKENKRGAPTKYRKEFVEQAKHLCKLGATTKDLADAFGVVPNTIELWMKTHVDFLRTVKENKQSANELVKQALFRRAVGCSIPDTDIRVIKDEIVETPLVKHYPPDTAACMAWLHNRDPERWRPRKAEEANESNEDSIINALHEISDKL